MMSVLILVFLMGCIVGFLVGMALVVDFLKRRGLLDESGNVIDLRRKDGLDDSSI